VTEELERFPGYSPAQNHSIPLMCYFGTIIFTEGFYSKLVMNERWDGHLGSRSSMC